ncbi:NADH-cytochrome b5 reductase 2-like [Tubulinosema ratisbonensis]|uniref:NADH-cytochrome b5 reductase 2-like n=1 Tax=Tubulinosema ratisbonensis TaxID=291195 RepID=A0A437ANJ6_9MICR|nr:NADH-cytochrome b5 reductase 2-like [Tubulinosema ratisbonensis]
MEKEFCKITEKIKLNHNTYKIKVSLNKIINPKISFFVKIHKEEASKPYSPIEYTPHSLTLIIKKYENGLVSKYVCEKEIGDSILVSFLYFKEELKAKKNVLMIAGGTGIAPMLQILIYAKQTNLPTNFTVMFFNQTDDDIFYKEELDSLAKTFYFVERGSHFLGIPSLDNIGNVVKNDKFDYVYVCGPPGMMECVSGKKNFDKTQGELKGILKELGFTIDKVYKF